MSALNNIGNKLKQGSKALAKSVSAVPDNVIGAVYGAGKGVTKAIGNTAVLGVVSINAGFNKAHKKFYRTYEKIQQAYEQSGARSHQDKSIADYMVLLMYEQAKKEKMHRDRFMQRKNEFFKNLNDLLKGSFRTMQIATRQNVATSRVTSSSSSRRVPRMISEDTMDPCLEMS